MEPGDLIWWISGIDDYMYTRIEKIENFKATIHNYYYSNDDDFRFISIERTYGLSYVMTDFVPYTKVFRDETNS